MALRETTCQEKLETVISKGWNLSGYSVVPDSCKELYMQSLRHKVFHISKQSAGIGVEI